MLTQQSLAISCGVWTIGREKFNIQAFQVEITCDKCTVVTDNNGNEVAYSFGGSKANFIYNFPLQYLHQLLANTIFIGHESQNKACLSEVFSRVVHPQ